MKALGAIYYLGLFAYHQWPSGANWFYGHITFITRMFMDYVPSIFMFEKSPETIC